MNGGSPAIARAGIWRPIAALGALAVAAVLFGFRDEFLAASLSSLYLISVLVAVAAVAAVGAAGRLRLWSSGFLFAVILLAFHLGIPIVRLLGAPIPYQALSYTNSWFQDTPQVRLALWLAVASLVGFALGYLLTSSRGDSTEPVVGDERQLRPSFAVPGLLLVVAGAVAYMGYAAAVAPSLFLGAGKTTYEDTIGSSGPVAWGTMLTSAGIIIAVAAPPSRARTWAIRVFVVFAVFTLVIGSRTAALYAVVAVVVAVARVRKMPRSRTALALIVGGLLLVSSVQQIRDAGLGKASLSDLLGSPAAGLHEMGASLRPVVETVGVVQGGTTHLRGGETFFVTLIRAAETVTGVAHQAVQTVAGNVETTVDPRWADSAIAERTPGLHIGYSLVAEAYLNFGALGTFLFFAVLGAGFGWWDNRRLGDPTSAARVAVVFVALIATVRQSSNVLLFTILFGLLAVEVARRWSARTPRPAGRRLASSKR